uniref:Uncharacterized protein n=1 Tax=Opuntia streptacantha TaxID=393608 RepID=A0A7C9EJI3_OPUST
MNSCFTKVGHEANECSVPFVNYFSECCRPRRHKNLPHPIFKNFHMFFINPQESNSSSFLGLLVLQIPNPIFCVAKRLLCHPYLRQYPYLKTTHAEKQVWIVLAVDRHKTVLPLQGSDASWKAILHVPEYTSTQVNIMFHQPHPSIPWPTLLVVVSNHILVIRIGMFSKVPLDKVPCLFMGEAEQYMHLVNITRIQPNRMPSLHLGIPVSHKFIWHLRGTSNFTSSGQS